MMNCGDIIDADSLQNSARITRIQLRSRVNKETISPVIVADERIASPHAWLDPIIKRQQFLDRLAERLCGQCPDCGDCGIAGDANAQYQCVKLRKAMGR